MPKNKNNEQSNIYLPENIYSTELPPFVQIEYNGLSMTVVLDFMLGDDVDTIPLPYDTHDHGYFEIFIVESGNMAMYIQGKQANFSGGDILILPPNTHHRRVSITDDANYFALGLLPNENNSIPYAHMDSFVKSTLSTYEKEAVLSTLHQLKSIKHPLRSQGDAYRRHNLLGVLLSYIFDRISKPEPHTNVEADTQLSIYRKIQSYLYHNYDKPLTLESLGAYLSYSRTQMRRIINDCYGMPFTEKLREIRLNAAKRMLREGKMSIDAIASKCGYETRQGFEAMFLKFVGVTPNKYRKEHAFDRQ